MIKRLISTIAFLALLVSPSCAVTIVNCQLCSRVSTTNETCPKPTGLAVGQLLLAIPMHTQSSTSGGTPASGFTNVENDGISAVCGQSINNGPAFTYVFYKVATSGDVAASSFLWQWPSGFGTGGGICALDFVGYSGGSPIDGGNTNISCFNNSFTGSTTVTANSVTTSVTNSRVFVEFNSSLQLGNSTITGPGGVNQDLTYSSGGSSNNFYLGDFLQATAGATGNKSGTQVQANQYTGMQIPILNGSAAGSGGLIWAFP